MNEQTEIPTPPKVDVFKNKGNILKNKGGIKLPLSDNVPVIPTSIAKEAIDPDFAFTTAMLKKFPLPSGIPLGPDEAVHGYSCILILFSNFTMAAVKLLVEYTKKFKTVPPCTMTAKYLRVMSLMGAKYPEDRRSELCTIADLYYYCLISPYSGTITGTVVAIYNSLSTRKMDAGNKKLYGDLQLWASACNSTKRGQVSLLQIIQLRGNIAHGNFKQASKKPTCREIMSYLNFLKGILVSLKELLSSGSK
jgi:hypothetical protein